MEGNAVLLDESKTSINECGKLLKEISSTCCMPERSANMTDVFTKLDRILEDLEAAKTNSDSVQKSITGIGDFGSLTGYLYATCCTETREPLYQKMFKEMNVAHGKLWAYLGHSH